MGYCPKKYMYTVNTSTQKQYMVDDILEPESHLVPHV